MVHRAAAATACRGRVGRCNPHRGPTLALKATARLAVITTYLGPADRYNPHLAATPARKATPAVRTEATGTPEEAIVPRDTAAAHLIVDMAAATEATAITAAIPPRLTVTAGGTLRRRIARVVIAEEADITAALEGPTARVVAPTEEAIAKAGNSDWS